MIKVIIAGDQSLTFSTFTKRAKKQTREAIGKKFPGAALTLFGCTFKAEKYLASYLNNLDESYIRTETIVILSIIGSSCTAPSKLNEYIEFSRLKKNPTVLVVYTYDPGLYSCWNDSIEISSTKYLGNANPDDIRMPRHDINCIELLDNSKALLAATPLYFATEYIYQLSENNVPAEIGFLDAPSEPLFENLFSITDGKVSPTNLFHCMPIWHRDLHDIVGYFDEDRYGTFADWALWLSALRSGLKSIFLDQPLGIYLIEHNSHNRVYPNLNEYLRNILMDIIVPALPSKYSYVQISRPHADPNQQKRITINLDSDCFGEHRSDFNRFAESVACSIQDSIDKICPFTKSRVDSDHLVLIPFIEKYFGWGGEPGEALSDSPMPIKKPWIGILHVPFDYPCCIDPIVSPKRILESYLFRASLSHAKALIFLSKHMEGRYHTLYPHCKVPTHSLRFFTSHNKDYCDFDYNLFASSPKALHIGDWLRCFYSFFRLSIPYPKILIKKSRTDIYIDQLSNFYYKTNDWLHSPTGELHILEMVDNKEYDILLSSSVVFANFLDTSANNLITECLERATPMIVNRHPAIIEYLGDEYPLYYDSLHEAERLLEDLIKIRQAHEYLRLHRATLDCRLKNDIATDKIARRLLSTLYI